MTEIIGKNTPASAKVIGYIDEVERVDKQIKDLQDIRTAIYARAKSEGYAPEGLKYVVKVRKMKPHQRQEAETTRDMYMFAAGMDAEPPLFRQIAALAKDVAGGEKLLEAFMLLAPPTGHLIITVQGRQVRVWRDKDGQPLSEDYTPAVPAQQGHSRTTLPPAAAKQDVPDCDDDGAEGLGRAAAKDNQPIINNPFPFDDPRRPRWDLGWRKETGNDGMGPN